MQSFDKNALSSGIRLHTGVLARAGIMGIAIPVSTLFILQSLLLPSK